MENKKDSILIDNPTTNVLYHYCSLEVFQKIITNKTIWLSDLSQSNDGAELVWIRQFCKEYFEKQLATQIENGLQERYKDILRKIEDNPYITWAFCLSEKRDNLGQWRGYADNGKGVAIGFFSKKIKHIADIQVYPVEGDFYRGFCKVKYCEKDERAFAQIVHDSVCGEENTQIVLNDNPLVQTLKCIFDLIRQETPLSLIQLNQHRFKNISFSEEKEWRLTFSYEKKAMDLTNLNWTSPDDPVLASQQIGFCVKNDTLVSHVELNLKNLDDLIANITIGPKCPITQEEMQMFLRANGINLDKQKIKKSLSTYR